MAKCKCSSRPKIVSNVVQSISCNKSCCRDVCANPICGDPDTLSLFAPLIYDEIGVNLCTTFPLGVDIETTYPTVTSAKVKAINATFTLGPTGVRIEALAGRSNCYSVTLTNITVQFAVELYDASCRIVDTIFTTAVYLPSDTTAPTFDEDTNPSSIELDIFAPYGFAYDTTTAVPTPAINFVGFSQTDNFVRQGINLFAFAKLLDFSTDESTVTVGLTLVLQSLYFAGYKVRSSGKIDTPKGSIISPDNSECMRFVAGDLLNLAIKPLDLGAPEYEEYLKNDCNALSCGNSCSNCGGASCENDGNTQVTDSTTDITE